MSKQVYKFSCTETGYRLYTNEDLLHLQQILTLKFLGFSLAEIKAYLQADPVVLQESLAVQKAMMQERREQLDAIIQAIDETEQSVSTTKASQPCQPSSAPSLIPPMSKA